ncbi:jg23148 [Pararge aegeria aegeria]|uniref:Jg23148 protein n=1 Tax=Pararge aegeria aegeria TaxID=348720 RepID=A0A8S4QH75_9NEOP|nr:jg23148 [Pararge aegeria aegeria]
MRIKIKFAHDDFKSEATSATECLPDQWIDISIVKKRETNTIEVSLNAGERLHVLLMEDVRDYQDNSKRFRSCITFNELGGKESIKNRPCKTSHYNETKHKEICSDDFFVGGLPLDIQNSLSEDFTPFSGVIAYVRVNNDLLDLHDYTMERDKDGIVQVSSRTASISGSYHETAWGESNKLNLTCLYARNSRSNHGPYWLYWDTVLQFNKNIRSDDDGKVLRLLVTADNDLKGFYTCRARGNMRTRNFVTYGVLGKINYKCSRPDTITVIAVLTTIALVIFTLAWLILEGYHDVCNGYGFYRDAHLSPEEEAEVVCKYIDQNLIGSVSAVNLAKANARRRGKRLASRASFGAQEPEGMRRIENDVEEICSDTGSHEPDELPPLPESKILGIEPSHEVYRCEPSYVSSPRHGSNITSCGTKLTSSSAHTSPRLLCTRLPMRNKSFPKESFPRKNMNSRCRMRDKTRLFTIKSSTLVNKSPVQKVLQKFQDIKSEDA